MTVYLVDSIVLLRLTDVTHAHHIQARDVVAALRHGRHELAVASQNCAEFWAVATRPRANNGLGLSVSDTNAELRLIEGGFRRLADVSEAYPIWRRLVVDYRVSGVQVHGARLVAAMLAHSVSHILTFNTSDFARYASEGVVAVAPTAD